MFYGLRKHLNTCSCLWFTTLILGQACGFSGDVLWSLRGDEVSTTAETNLRHIALYLAAKDEDGPFELYYAPVVDGQPQNGAKVNHALETDAEVEAFASSSDGNFVIYSVRRVDGEGAVSPTQEDAAVYVVDFRDGTPKAPVPVPNTSGFLVRGGIEIFRSWSVKNRFNFRLAATDESAAPPDPSDETLIVVDASRLVDGDSSGAVLERRSLEQDLSASDLEIRTAWSPDGNWLSLRLLNNDGSYRTELVSLASGQFRTHRGL